jgi:regulatory protein
VQIKENTLFEKVLNYLSYRARSKQEIITYLNGKHATATEIKEIVAKLNDLNLIDDQKFAFELIHAKVSKGDGPQKIYSNLLNKGIDKEIIKSEINKISDEEWTQAATKKIHNKQRLWDKYQGYKKKQKIYQLLASWGYRSNTIKAVIDAILHQE